MRQLTTVLIRCVPGRVLFIRIVSKIEFTRNFVVQHTECAYGDVQQQTTIYILIRSSFNLFCPLTRVIFFNITCGTTYKTLVLPNSHTAYNSLTKTAVCMVGNTNFVGVSCPYCLFECSYRVTVVNCNCFRIGRYINAINQYKNGIIKQ